MSLSDEKTSHLSHLILNHFKDPARARLKVEEVAVLREIKRVLAAELQVDAVVDAVVRRRLASYSSPLAEGSTEWETMYRKTFEEEMRKRFGLEDHQEAENSQQRSVQRQAAATTQLVSQKAEHGQDRHSDGGQFELRRARRKQAAKRLQVAGGADQQEAAAQHPGCPAVFAAGAIFAGQGERPHQGRQAQAGGRQQESQVAHQGSRLQPENGQQAGDEKQPAAVDHFVETTRSQAQRGENEDLRQGHGLKSLVDPQRAGVGGHDQQHDGHQTQQHGVKIFTRE